MDGFAPVIQTRSTFPDKTPMRSIHPTRRPPTRPQHAGRGRFILRSLLLSVCCAAGAGAGAADNAAASAALKVLMAPMGMGQPQADMPPGLPATAALGAGLARQTTQVQRGEGLDAVIRRTLPGLPLKEDFLRRAYMRVNPQVYPTPALRKLPVGTTLLVPSLDELRQMFKEQGPLAANWLQPPAESADEHEPTHSKGQDKRRWVRYP